MKRGTARAAGLAVGALTTLLLGLVATPAAHAALERVGPNDPVHGFPQWYQDASGLTLDFCSPLNQAELEGGWCGVSPPLLRAAPEVFSEGATPGRFASEHLYFEADARLSNPAPGFPGFSARLSLQLKAAFRAGTVAKGDQVTVGRVRIVFDRGVPASGTYTVYTPYGAFTLPFIQCIINNGWAISVPRSAQTGAQTLAQKGLAGGLHCLQVDGNDLIAMRSAMDHAIKRARHGHGGMVIEAVTYRLSDHTTADDARRYRPDDEVKAAWQREPLKRLKAYLVGLNAWTEQEEEDWKADCAQRVDAEVNAYLETKSQPVEAMFDYTWAELPADLAAQRAQALGADKAPH